MQKNWVAVFRVQVVHHQQDSHAKRLGCCLRSSGHCEGEPSKEDHFPDIFCFVERFATQSDMVVHHFPLCSF